MSTSGLISIIIPNYNGEKYLYTCLSSVRRSTYKNFEVILVDDGSVDESLAIIRKFMKKDNRIRLLQNAKNLGAAASRNKAAKIANGGIFVFLDNDTEVHPQFLFSMQKTLKQRRNIGACQGKIIDFHKRTILQGAGVKLWAQTGWGLPIGQWQKHTLFNKEEKIAGLSAALAVRRDVFEEADGFDTKEAVVTEDLDFSWRIWLLGYQVILSPQSFIYHWTKTVDMRSNMGHNYTDIYFHLTKNSLTSICKNYEFINVIRFFFTSIAISFGRGFLVLLKRKDTSALEGTLKATGWIIFNSPYILFKRFIMQRKRRVSDKYLFKNIFIQGSPLKIYKKYFLVTELL